MPKVKKAKRKSAEGGTEPLPSKKKKVPPDLKYAWAEISGVPKGVLWPCRVEGPDSVYVKCDNMM